MSLFKFPSVTGAPKLRKFLHTWGYFRTPDTVNTKVQRKKKENQVIEMYKEILKSTKMYSRKITEWYQLLEIQVLLKSIYFLPYWRDKAKSMPDPKAGNHSH